MKRQILWITMIAAVAVMLGIALYLNRTGGAGRDSAAQPPADTAGPDTPTRISGLDMPVPSGWPAPAIASDEPVAQSTDDGEPQPPRRFRTVRSDQLLASVNGIPIRLQDITSLREGQTEMTIEEDIFQAMLARAIDMELTFQAARGMGVELGQHQQALLDRVATQNEMNMNMPLYSGSIVYSSVTPEQIAFQDRLHAALSLQKNLMEQLLGIRAYPNVADIERYYQQHLDRYGPLPAEPAERDAAWKSIQADILRQLTPQMKDEYKRKLQDLLDQLKAAYQVQVFAQNG
jgi:hypothetical protein